MLIDEWNVLKARIDGLAATSQIVLMGHSHSSGDVGMTQLIKAECSDLNEQIQGFARAHADDLPPSCQAAIDEHLALASHTPYTGGDAPLLVAALCAPFVALSARIAYLLADTQQAIRLLADRAFVHLRRSIEVNESVRADWRAAFDGGEVRCEQLGSTHLLLHGIYAFKVDATGARTDLVYPEPINQEEATSVANGLVLTEWKKVASASDTIEKAAAGKKQAALYAESALAGIELRQCRYIVLVSHKGLPNIPSISKDQDIEYRYVNIPVDPDPPSRAARA